MFRRKRTEFRPDTVRRDILGKLLLTRKQRLTVARWLLYSLVCLVALLLQDVVMSRFRIFGATLDLVPCCILAVCILQGGEAGCVFALVSSLIYYLSGSSPGVMVIPTLCILAVFGAIFRQAYLRPGFATLMLCLAVTMLLYELVQFALALSLELTRPDRPGAQCLGALLTLAVVPLTYPILMSIGKIGGETWKE